ncbi:hypothetical protein [Thermodesulfovibrio thiophilus]|uniref:hypothetical protein n=1 Tax=Thermodesulfovibrio thiophilus TaxID=340095 RepID=UPI0003FDBC6C|nr:hypothetical protein [Thermodesulfovibrio thiophilus]
MEDYTKLSQIESFSEHDEYVEFMAVALSSTCVKRAYGELCFEEETLRKYADTLMGKPVLLDHRYEAGAIIGVVIHSEYDHDKKAILAKIRMPKAGNERLITLLKMVPSPVRSLSIGAIIETEKKDGKFYATSIDFKELSIVFEGADKNAKILSFEESSSKNHEKFSEEEWWDDPELRKKAPLDYFLEPGSRRFPYKTWDGNISCERLRAAMSLANLHGYRQIYERANALYEKHCKKED